MNSDFVKGFQKVAATRYGKHLAKTRWKSTPKELSKKITDVNEKNPISKALKSSEYIAETNYLRRRRYRKGKNNA